MMDRHPAVMSRRQAIKTVAGAGVALIGAPMLNRGRFSIFAGSAADYSARTIELVGRSLVIDMLSPLTLNDEKQDRWLSGPQGMTAEELEEFYSSGINIFHIATGVGGIDAYQNVLRFVARWNAFLADYDRHFLRVDSVGDLERVKESGKIGVIIGLQNSAHFRRAEDVDLFHRLGQRVSQLTYNRRNLIGNGSTERTDGGLSDLGVAVVARMNEVGMAVDVSHCGDQTTLDAFEVSKKPVLITHSNARALVPGHPRCKTDEAIRSMARTGGVMGITGVRMFVRGREPTTIEHFLDHFGHVTKLIGVEHLGIGSDIDLHGYDDMPSEQNEQLRSGYKDSYGFREKIDIEGIDHPKRVFDLTEGLVRRGYSDDAIEGILGGNFKRVLSEIWSTPSA